MCQRIWWRWEFLVHVQPTIWYLIKMSGIFETLFICEIFRIRSLCSLLMWFSIYVHASFLLKYRLDFLLTNSSARKWALDHGITWYEKQLTKFKWIQFTKAYGNITIHDYRPTAVDHRIIRKCHDFFEKKTNDRGAKLISSSKGISTIGVCANNVNDKAKSKYAPIMVGYNDLR